MAGEHLRRARPRSDWRATLAVLIALVLGLAVGAGATVLLDDDEPEVETSGEESSAAGGDGVAVARPDPGPVTLAFVGDIYAELSLAQRLEAQPDDFVGPFADVLRDADLAVGNVEAAITTGGEPEDKDFTFRVPPSILDALRAGGIDVVSAANDHAIDYGSGGLAETVEVKRARDDGMVIGIGGDEDDAYAPFVTDVGGHRVAVIAATQVIDSERIADWTAQADTGGVASAKRVDRLAAEVEAVRDEVDTVVAYVHWGAEAEVCPDPAQQELADALVEAGADVVVGTNAHRVQGAGRLGDALVGYGLGNFLFGAPNEESARSGVLLVDVDGREVLDYRWVPGEIEDRVPYPLEGDDAAAAVDDWEARRDCTGLEP